MKKIAAAWLILSLLCSFPHVQAEEEQLQRHDWVETMFRAAIGTTFEDEQDVRAGLTDDEIQARSAELASYRAETEIWLIRSFQTEYDETEEDPALEIAWSRFSENEYGRAWIETLENLGAETRQDGIRISREICGEWLAEIDVQRLTEINADYSFWIYAPDMPIDYPVVQGDDNRTWLHRMFDGTSNAAGTLFVDSRNLPDFQDPNTLVYGHHMRNDSMFGALDNYQQAGYCDSHPWMLIIAKERTYLVEILAGYTTSKSDHCYDIAISDSADRQAFLEEARSKSDFAILTEILPEAPLITLSTCAYAFEDARYIVIGQLQGLDNVLDNGGDISEQIELTNQIIGLIQDATKEADFAALDVDRRAEQLLALLRDTDPGLAVGKTAADMVRPETSIAQSSLFTGAMHA